MCNYNPFTRWKNNEKTDIINHNLSDFSSALTADLEMDMQLKRVVYMPEYNKYLVFYKSGNEEDSQIVEESMVDNFIMRYTAYKMIEDVIRYSVNLDEWGEKRILRMSTF